jgi:hypothetical protein
MAGCFGSENDEGRYLLLHVKDNAVRNVITSYLKNQAEAGVDAHVVFDIADTEDTTQLGEVVLSH